ncbi:MBL fold metallo-hydrolase [Acinetobacter sp. ANC 5054]|uniref:MBL fold metallo-hydrolase n=1 Tax=Acinetobacter sp. ANC 5054 TaxID=1977877 RepID=UPI001BB467D3|nr:MBL fold metallo-hydrolase [Acinetobacter sp. ANC 5054]
MKNISFAVFAAGIFSSHLLFAEPVSVQTEVKINAAQPLGYFDFQVGQYKVVALRDGSLELSPSLFSKNISPEERSALFTQLSVDQTKGIQTSVNAYLIDDGQGGISLIDSGAASCFGANLGSIAQNIEAAGYKLNRIRTVFLTHLHPDHACGMSKDGKAVFPNATVYVNELENAYWLGDTTVTSLPEEKRQGFLDTVNKIKAAVAPYQTLRSFKTFSQGSVINGIEVLASVGHTPGHYSYLIKSQGKSFAILGDVVHSHHLQFEQPKLSVDFDVDPIQASETRIAIFKRFAQEQSFVAFAHLAFPGIGKISEMSEGHFRWNPINLAPSVIPAVAQAPVVPVLATATVTSHTPVIAITPAINVVQPATAIQTPVTAPVQTPVIVSVPMTMAASVIEQVVKPVSEPLNNTPTTTAAPSSVVVPVAPALPTPVGTVATNIAQNVGVVSATSVVPTLTNATTSTSTSVVAEVSNVSVDPAQTIHSTPTISAPNNAQNPLSVPAKVPTTAEYLAQPL